MPLQQRGAWRTPRRSSSLVAHRLSSSSRRRSASEHGSTSGTTNTSTRWADLQDSLWLAFRRPPPRELANHENHGRFLVRRVSLYLVRPPLEPSSRTSCVSTCMTHGAPRPRPRGLEAFLGHSSGRVSAEACLRRAGMRPRLGARAGWIGARTAWMVSVTETVRLRPGKAGLRRTSPRRPALRARIAVRRVRSLGHAALVFTYLAGVRNDGLGVRFERGR